MDNTNKVPFGLAVTCQVNGMFRADKDNYLIVAKPVLPWPDPSAK